MLLLIQRIFISEQLLRYYLSYIQGGEFAHNPFAISASRMLQGLFQLSAESEHVELAVQDTVLSAVEEQDQAESLGSNTWHSLKAELDAANVIEIQSNDIAIPKQSSDAQTQELRNHLHVTARSEETAIAFAVVLKKAYSAALRHEGFTPEERTQLRSEFFIPQTLRALQNKQILEQSWHAETVNIAPAKSIQKKKKRQQNVLTSLPRTSPSATTTPVAGAKIVSAALPSLPHSHAAAIQALLNWGGGSAIAQLSSAALGLLLVRLLWGFNQLQQANSGSSDRFSQFQRPQNLASILGSIGNAVNRFVREGAQQFNSPLSEIQVAIEDLTLQNLRDISPLLHSFIDIADEVVTDGFFRPGQAFIAELFETFDGEAVAIAPSVGFAGPLQTVLDAVESLTGSNVTGNLSSLAFLSPEFTVSTTSSSSITSFGLTTAGLLPSETPSISSSATFSLETPAPNSGASSGFTSIFETGISETGISGTSSSTGLGDGLETGIDNNFIVSSQSINPDEPELTTSLVTPVSTPLSEPTSTNPGLTGASSGSGGLGEAPGETLGSTPGNSPGSAPGDTPGSSASGDDGLGSGGLPIINTNPTPPSGSPSTSDVEPNSPTSQEPTTTEPPISETPTNPETPTSTNSGQLGILIPQPPTEELSPGADEVRLDLADGANVIEISEPSRSGTSDVLDEPGNNRPVTWIIENFGGIGTGTSPSEAVVAEVDTLKLNGANFTPETLNLSQVGGDTWLQFDNVPNFTIQLVDFAVENFDNLVSSSATATVGNLLFADDPAIRDRFDVFNHDWTRHLVLNPDTVTILNDRDNEVWGIETAENVINGLAGNDTLVGGRWNDLLRGDRGDDNLLGGGGTNLLVGGDGHDAFHSSLAGLSIAADFNPDVDRLVLGQGLNFADLSFQRSETPIFNILGSQLELSEVPTVGTLVTANNQALLMLPGFLPDQIDASWFA